MKCVIPGRFVKLFGRSIHCLSKIGDELYIEATTEGLALRTVNSSRSAFGCFLFNESFFCEYTDKIIDVPDDCSQEFNKFKISMKSVIGVFKSLHTIERTVDTCKLEYDHKETRIVFKLFCKHGIVKTHKLTFQDCESMQAVFSKELNPNLILAQARVLIDTVSNFPNNCEEVTLGCSAENLNLKNYLEDEPDPSKVVHTEMKLHPEEFDNYQIGVDTEITFCLKEARAILAFSEFVNQPISIHFSNGGKPVVFSLDGDSLYTADFVLATLMDSMSSQATQNASQQTVQRQKPASKYKKKNTKKYEPTEFTGKSKNASSRQDENDDDDDGLRADETITEEGPGRRSFSTPTLNHQDMDETTYNQRESEEFPLLVNKSTTYESEQQNQSKNSNMPRLGESIQQGNETDMIEDGDVLPATPPSKKFKSIFFGLTKDDMKKRRKLHETVLAPDTDDES